MDHLVLPTDASRPLLRVPFVWKCNYPLGQVPFSEYPVYFMKQLADDHRDWAADNDEVLRTLVQNWLYFGVLHEVFGDSVRPELFKRRDSKFGNLLYTKPLQSLRQSWAADQAFIKDPHSMNNRKIRILSAAVQAYELLEEEVESGTIVVQNLKAILLSVKILLCSLSSMIQAVVENSPLESDATTLLRRLTFARYSLDKTILQEQFPFYQHMLDNHWCPLQIQDLLSKLTITTVCYFACMKRRQRSGIISHQSCLNEEFCIAYSLRSQTDSASSEAQFETHHTTLDCTCTEDITVPEPAIMEIIEAGNIPVVNFEIPDSGEPVTYTIESLEQGSKYTAISHVWADGLGNPERNAMAACQVKQLISRINTMQHPASRDKKMWLWIDAFSIPNVPKDDGTLDPAGQRRRLRATEAKDKAIGMMTAIYAGAEFVLALDSELNSYSMQGMSFTELTARCFVCGWKGRAWTLQEGSLATHLGVQLADGFVFAKEMQIRYDEAMKIASWNRSFDELAQLLQDCRQAWFLPSVGSHRADSSNKMSGRDVQLMEVWNNLIGKTTTKPDDFYQIVANLLDFKISWVRHHDSIPNRILEARPVAIESMILYHGSVPMELLCLPQITTNTGGSNSNLDTESIHSHRLSFKPRGIQLNPQHFRTCFCRDQYSTAPMFRLERTNGVVAYKFDVPRDLPAVFCVRPGGSSEWDSIFHFQLSLPLRLSHGHIADQCSAVLYFSSASNSRLLRDTTRTGACFIVMDSAAQGAGGQASLALKYFCNFTYRPCRDRNCQIGSSQSICIFPITFREYHDGISIHLGRAWPNPGRRRFLNLVRVQLKGSHNSLGYAVSGLIASLSLVSTALPLGVVTVPLVAIVTVVLYLVLKWRLNYYIKIEQELDGHERGLVLALKRAEFAFSYKMVKHMQDNTEDALHLFDLFVKEWILGRSISLRWETSQENIRRNANIAESNNPVREILRQLFRLWPNISIRNILDQAFLPRHHETSDECLVCIPVQRAPSRDTDVFESFGAAIADMFLYMRHLLAEPVLQSPDNDDA